jgi:hypothetical protein
LLCFSCMYVALIEKKKTQNQRKRQFCRKFTVETTAEAVIEFSVCQFISDLSLPRLLKSSSSPSPRFCFVFVFVGVSVFSFLLDLFCFCFCGCFYFFFSFRINFACDCELVVLRETRERERSAESCQYGNLCCCWRYWIKVE